MEAGTSTHKGKSSCRKEGEQRRAGMEENTEHRVREQLLEITLIKHRLGPDCQGGGDRVL